MFKIFYLTCNLLYFSSKEMSNIPIVEYIEIIPFGISDIDNVQKWTELDKTNKRKEKSPQEGIKVRDLLAYTLGNSV